MIKVRTLYLEKRFKNCIATCDELLQGRSAGPATPNFRSSTSNLSLHPVHQAFLIFHQAISNECLGLAAHKFSQNKISFLKAAQTHFKAALDMLPQPFASRYDASYETPQITSPDSDFFGDDTDVSRYPDATEQALRLSYDTPTFRISDATRSPSQESFDSVTSGTSISATYTVPDFDQYSPRISFGMVMDRQGNALLPGGTPSGLPRSLPSVNIDPIESSSSDDEDEPEHSSGWLPRSMRSLNLAAHTVDVDSDDEFRASDTKHLALPNHTPTGNVTNSLRVPLSQSSSHTSRLSASLSSKHLLCQDLIPSPLFSRTKKMPKLVNIKGTLTDGGPPRPLPRTPHAHLSHLTLLPARKTAVQTLISKYEGKLPLPDTPSSYVTATPPASASFEVGGPTPVTQRFNTIHDAFEPAAGRNHLTEYLTSRSLAQHNSNLAAFRTCLLSAHEKVAQMLEEAVEVQHKHNEEKRTARTDDDETGMPKNRLASLWLLSTPGKPKRSRPFAPQSGNPVSVSPARMMGRSKSLRDRKRLPLRNRVEESEEKRAERIEKLRSNGFQVHKERHGWKGDEYYEGFRRRVEIDLSALA